MSLSTSFPHTSHPGVFVRANNSILGRSPINCTIRVRTSSGFSLCRPRLATTSCLIFFTILFGGFPRTPSKHTSTLPIVHLPRFATSLSFVVRFDQTTATVLNLNPHERITSMASGSCGDTAQRNSTASSSASPPCISSDLIQPRDCVSYSWSREKECPFILSLYDHGGSA